MTTAGESDAARAEAPSELSVGHRPAPPRGGSVGDWLRVAGSGVLRRASGTGMRPIRALGGIPGFASAMIDVDALERERSTLGDISISRLAYDEPARNPVLVSGSDPVPDLGGVRTTVSLLDIREPGYSLRNGHLVDPHRRVIFETEVVRSFPFMRIALTPLERPSHVPGVVACLTQVHNYGHWNLLALPLVEHYRRALGGDPDYYYVGAHLGPWQLESLSLLGIPESKLLRRPVTADRLVVAIADRAEGYDSEFLLFADRALLPNQHVAPGSGSRRLFVSRASARQRRLVNEQACLEALAGHDVELVSTERMTLEDEITLFRQAELVVGANGAGLTNAIFAPPGAALVELSPSSIWVSQLAQIAAAKGLRYGLLNGPPVGPRVGVPATHNDFAVDVERLSAIVRAALRPAG